MDRRGAGIRMRHRSGIQVVLKCRDKVLAFINTWLWLLARRHRTYFEFAQHAFKHRRFLEHIVGIHAFECEFATEVIVVVALHAIFVEHGPLICQFLAQ